MGIRRVRRADILQIARLYFKTVHEVNARDYSPEQIRAWVPRVYPDAFWQRRFRRYEVFVAEDGGAVVGFVELGRTGEIDCFYVHHGHQGRGIGAHTDRYKHTHIHTQTYWQTNVQHTHIHT